MEDCLDPLLVLPSGDPNDGQAHLSHSQYSPVRLAAVGLMACLQRIPSYQGRSIETAPAQGLMQVTIYILKEPC